METKAEAKSIVFSPGDTKGKEAVEAVNLPDDLFPNPTPAKDCRFGFVRYTGDDHLAVDSGKTVLNSSEVMIDSAL